ncbi:MAG: hypothetical protein DI534_12150 [Leifsonia xyli]|nr:MAG: hypothetical protein DI534_12150 [Leifsonia xyli]
MRRVIRLLSRYRVTVGMLTAFLAVNIVNGALTRYFELDDPFYRDVAYGLPSLLDGRWWTLVTGMFFVSNLWIYIPILIQYAITSALYERRAGHARTLLVTFGGQVLGSLVTSLVVLAALPTGWHWAKDPGSDLDTGMSIAAFALLGALTAAMQPVWRRRVRIVGWALVIVLFLDSAQLWDLEHLVGFALGVFAGPFVLGRRPERPGIRFGPRTQRVVAAGIVAVVGLETILEGFLPAGLPQLFTVERTGAPSGIDLTLVVIALLLLFAADALRRGRRLAWIFATAFLALGVFAIAVIETRAQRVADLIIFGGVLLVLLLTARAFTVRIRRRAFRRTFTRLGWVLLGLAAYAALGFFALQDEFRTAATPLTALGEFLARLLFLDPHLLRPTTHLARFFLHSIGLVWVAAIVVSLVQLFYSSRRPSVDPDAAERLRGILRRNDSATVQWMLTWRGITPWFSADGETAIGYHLAGSVALVLGDPVGPPERRVDALREFDAFCFANGWIPCLFSAGEATAASAPVLGWKSVEIAEDSSIELPGLAFTGKRWNDVRTALNRAEREEVGYTETRWTDAAPVVTDQLRIISGGWVDDKALPEMRFTLGTLAEADDPEVRLSLATDATGTVQGFTSWLPVHRDGRPVGWTLDLMRRRDDGFRPVMEFLIGEAAASFRDQGYEFLSLSAAPLAKAPERLGANSDGLVLQRILDFLGGVLEPYYGFRSLFRFKQKFNPVHRSQYLVYPDETALVEIGVAIVRAYLPDARARDWLRLSWGLVRPEREEPAPRPAETQPDGILPGVG